MFKTEDLETLITSLQCRDEGDTIEVLDAAYWFKIALCRARRYRQKTKASTVAIDIKQWLTELSSQRSKTLDAPSWRGTSVVELIANHETAYLEHCGKHSLLAKAG